MSGEICHYDKNYIEAQKQGFSEYCIKIQGKELCFFFPYPSCTLVCISLSFYTNTRQYNPKGKHTLNKQIFRYSQEKAWGSVHSLIIFCLTRCFIFALLLIFTQHLHASSKSNSLLHKNPLFSAIPLHTPFLSSLSQLTRLNGLRFL